MITTATCDRYMITGYFTTQAVLFERVNMALALGVRLIQFRAPWLQQNEYVSLAQTLSNKVRAADATLIVKGDYALLAQSWCHGLHLTSHQLSADVKVQKHNSSQLLAASCHDARQIKLAQTMPVDFITLSPIYSTPSHPDAIPLGLVQATKLTAIAAVPVFWLGGMTVADITTAQKFGAYGIAAIREFWGKY